MYVEQHLHNSEFLLNLLDLLRYIRPFLFTYIHTYTPLTCMHVYITLVHTCIPTKRYIHTYIDCVCIFFYFDLIYFCLFILPSFTFVSSSPSLFLIYGQVLFMFLPQSSFEFPFTFLLFFHFFLIHHFLYSLFCVIGSLIK